MQMGSDQNLTMFTGMCGKTSGKIDKLSGKLMPERQRKKTSVTWPFYDF